MLEKMTSEIVISGISGRFPESDNVEEFYEKLLTKIDPITEDNKRFIAGIYFTPKGFGKMKDLSKFDSEIFNLNSKDIHEMDPQRRILLEVTYETIVDAGYDPSELRGKKIGVFIGSCCLDSFILSSTCVDQEKCTGLAVQGHRRGLTASTINYVFDFKGPSMNIDVACASSAQAFYQAYQSIQCGNCDAAIVVGSNIITLPQVSVGFNFLKMLSKDCKSKAFDKSVDGYARSEAIAAVFLQKYSDARRNYASIVHTKTNNDGFKIEGVTYPSHDGQKSLLSGVWRESDLDPCKITYVEAHATGTVAGDVTEMSVIDEIFCRGREKPLLVGSMKSNMGHSEGASCICQMVKVILSMEKEIIPPNMHFNEPHPEIKALIEGRAKVVTEPTPFNGPYIAVNSFGFGGSNMHCILKCNPVTLHPKSEQDNLIPQLVLYCGRTLESVQFAFDNTTLGKAPSEFFALLHKSSFASPTLKPYRGYKLLGMGKDFEEIKLIRYEKRKLWYTFSGNITQWPAAVDDLMQIETFVKSYQKSLEILKAFQFDFQEFSTNKFKNDASTESKKIKQIATVAIVTTTVFQIALIDLLNELGLKPDGIIGQCHGEMLCAYADGCFTAEQTLLASYWLAKFIEEASDVHDILTRLHMLKSDSLECYACECIQNSGKVFGPLEKDEVSVAEVKPENDSGRDMNPHNFTNIITNASPGMEKLLFHLEKVIPNPNVRSSRWIACSYPKDKWNDSETKVASASYFLRCLFSPGYFDDALKSIPQNAIVVEIGPHDIHNTILKKEILPDASFLSLIKVEGNNVVNLLSSIGKLYISGFDPDIEKLYPAVAFPVPRSTPGISSLVKWNHSESWSLSEWIDFSFCPVSDSRIYIGMAYSPDRFLLGHCIDERCLYPATKYLVMVYSQFDQRYYSDIEGYTPMHIPIVFEKVKFFRATMVSETSETIFMIHISKTSGYFEVTESGMVVCNGYIRSPNNKNELRITSDIELDRKSLILNTKDIYKEFRIIGYDYGLSFQGILAANLFGCEGILKWSDNLITYMDTMMQIALISLNKRILLLPIEIEKITLDPKQHEIIAEKAMKEYKGIPMKYNSETREYCSGGIYIKNLKVGYQTKRPSSQSPLLEEYKFFPYELDFPLNIKKSQYQEYIDVCSSISERILKHSVENSEQIVKYISSPIVSDELIDKYVKSEENCYVLLKCLSRIVNSQDIQNMSGNVKDYVSAYIKELENDFLLQILLNESTLRTVCEVVLENLSSLNIKIVEIAEGSQTISFKLHEYNPNPELIKMSYSIVHNETEILSQDHVPPNADIVAWENKPSLDFQDADLFILNHLKYSISDARIILENAAACLKDEGFILLLVKTKLIPAEEVLSSLGLVYVPKFEDRSLEQTFEELNLNIICKIFDSFTSTLYLLRKSKTWSDEDLIVHITAHEYDQWVEDLKKTMVQSPDSLSSRIWLVNESSCHSGILGLVNCLRLEPGGHNIRCVFTGKENSKIPKFNVKHPFYKKQLEKNLLMNVFQNGCWGSYRHIRYNEDTSTTMTENAYLNVLTIGDLSSFAWIPLSVKDISSADDEVICHVYYSSLNFRDVMLATGRMPPSAIPSTLAVQSCLIGSEFSGRTFDGRRIMGITISKGMATTVTAKRKHLWDVPDEWTLEQAATVPMVYVTVYNALIVRGKLQKGESILIHSGSGGVGQAAIAISLYIGCSIYTTVGSEKKKEFLKKRFPQLSEEHIYNSRYTTFEQHVLHATKGEGVDAVLNSLSGDKLIATLNCLADGGRFLEIGKYDMFNNTNLGMDIFLKNLSFHGISLDVLMEDSEHDIKDEVAEFTHPLEKIIAEGIVRHLDTTVFNHEEVEQAFRYMASGKHIGKVLLKIREEETEKKAIPVPVSVTAIQRTIFHPEKSYIIIGGVGGMGLELCQWLIDRGARNVILTSRSGITTGYQKLCLQRWEQLSVNVVISKLDAIRLDDTKSLLLLAEKYGHVGGIFNLALVLKDGFMEKQTVQTFIDVCGCKVETTKNLDILTRELYPDLEWFVCFSSVSCGRGNPSQSNYAYANSVMERICEDRVDKGFSGLAIQWGPVGDVGVVEETMGSSNAVIFGTVPQRIGSCLEVLDKFLQQNHPVMSSFVPYLQDKDKANLNKKDLLAYMANIFGIKDVNLINPESTLSELGMDSLIAVELRQILESNFDTVFTIPELQKLKVKQLKKVTGHDDTDSTKNATESLKFDIGMYLRNFKINTDIPVEVIIHMNTITEGLPLFLVHPIEGSAFLLKPLAENFLCPVYAIQSTLEAPRDSIENLASFYWKNVKSLNISLQSINLLGYSFGATVAFEMALQAEQETQNYPDIKNLIFLDGSPNFATNIMSTNSSRFDETIENIRDQITALIAFSMMFSEDEMFLDRKELFRMKSLTERKNYTASKIASLYPDIGADDILSVFDAYSSKLQMSVRYHPKYKLKKDVYLVKSSRNLQMESATDLYDLEYVCEGKITSNTVEGSHINFIQDESAKEIASLLKDIF